MRSEETKERRTGFEERREESERKKEKGWVLFIQSQLTIQHYKLVYSVTVYSLHINININNGC